MNCTEVVKARVSPEMKRQVTELAERELLTEAAWLKRLIIREIRAANETDSAASVSPIRLPGEVARGASNGVKRVYVRLCPEDWLLLEARAAARGLRPATYLAVLARSQLRSLAPLPKAEYLALMRSIAELGAIGRNINQIAHAANSGRPIPDSVAAEFRAMLKVCEALRDNTKALLKANLASWSTGRSEAPP
jgi:Bacterial mobilisation protein (MobC).